MGGTVKAGSGSLSVSLGGFFEKGDPLWERLSACRYRVGINLSVFSLGNVYSWL
jgi:hypothetical protein